jgi:hypothetical protein
MSMKTGDKIVYIVLAGLAILFIYGLSYDDEKSEGYYEELGKTGYSENYIKYSQSEIAEAIREQRRKEESCYNC